MRLLDALQINTQTDMQADTQTDMQTTHSHIQRLYRQYPMAIDEKQADQIRKAHAAFVDCDKECVRYYWQDMQKGLPDKIKSKLEQIQEQTLASRDMTVKGVGAAFLGALMLDFTSHHNFKEFFAYFKKPVRQLDRQTDKMIANHPRLYDPEHVHNEAIMLDTLQCARVNFNYPGLAESVDKKTRYVMAFADYRKKHGRHAPEPLDALRENMATALAYYQEECLPVLPLKQARQKH